VRSVRLLPIVIFAALALLIFKGVGLVTNGGYVLPGATAVVAEEGGGEPDMPVSPTPPESTMTDSSPTLGDGAPTLPAAKSDAEAGGEHGASSASASEHSSEGSSSEASSQAVAAAPVCPDTTTPPPPEHAPASASAAPGQHDLADKMGNALAKGCPSVEIPVNAHGDVLPSTKDGNGKIVPLAVAEGDDSQGALIDRLGARRAELDKREAELNMRQTLVEAAEQKLADQAKQLEALQAEVNALVDQKQAAEDAGFKGIVAMYENMKPKDAAKIFDTLDLNTLLKVARAMNPRKMSPILAAMNAEPAQALTTAFATTGDSDTVAETSAASGQSQNLAALPQIVGH
jgi:flagellar motility protein MotE (MotC chaperone)